MNPNVLNGAQKIFEASERRCDQCTRKHQRCNKTFPTCSRCSRLSLPCTWNRPVLKHSLRRYENVEKFYLNGKRSNENKSVGKDFVFSHLTKPAKDQTMNYPNQLEQRLLTTFSYNLIPNISFPSNLVLMFENWSSRCDARSELRYFSRLAGLPFYGATVNDKLFLGQFLLTKKPPRFDSEEFYSQFYNQLYFTFLLRNEVLQTALDAYFHYLNPFFPLFTRLSYDSRPRSEFLKLSIWRIGLQFLNNSSLKSILIKELEERLLTLMRPSCLVWNLDTFQAIIAISIGIYEGSLQCKVISLFNIATTMVHCLGLHLHCAPLYVQEQNNELLLFERHLALIQLNQADEICFLRSGEFSMSAFPNSTYSLKAATRCLSSWDQSSFMDPTLLFLKYLTFLSRSTRKRSLSDDPNFFSQTSATEYTKNVFKLPTHLGSYTSLSGAMDTCIFITSLCSNSFINIFKEVQSVFNQVQNDGTSAMNLLSAINRAEKQLHEVFVKGFQHLHCAKLMSSPVAFTQTSLYCEAYHLNSQPFSTSPRLFELYNCPTENLIISQMQLMLNLRYNFFKILVLELGTHTNPFSSHILAPKFIDVCATEITFKVLVSACKLIDLLSLVSSGHFSMLRDFLLMVPSRFIIQHFHSYNLQFNKELPSSSILSLSGSNINSITTYIINSINKARQIFTSLSHAPVGSYYTNSNLALLEELVEKFQIPM